VNYEIEIVLKMLYKVAVCTKCLILILVNVCFRWSVQHKVQTARCIWCLPVPCRLQSDGIYTSI